MFSENLDAFFNTATGFAVASTLQGGPAGGVSAIHDAAYLEQMGIAGVKPAALVKASAVAVSDIGKTLTIGATTYTIKGREPIDDGALVLLTLRV